MTNGSSVSRNTMLQLTNQSLIYLGGLPANQSVNIDNFLQIILFSEKATAALVGFHEGLLSELELGVLVFQGEGKPERTRREPVRARREPTTNSTHT